MKRKQFIEKWQYKGCCDGNDINEPMKKQFKQDLDKFGQHVKEECVDVLKRYEKWEAKVILEDSCWEDGLPKLTQELYEEFLEIQELRNKAIRE